MSYNIGQIANQFNKTKMNLNVTNYAVGNVQTDNAIQLNDSSFLVDNSYYLKCHIKKLNVAQNLQFWLVGGNKNAYNFKTVTIAAGDGWETIDFGFSPVIDGFNTIAITTNASSLVIAYDEFSKINSVLPKTSVKIGVQSKNGTKMMINNDEIHIGSTNLYELRNENITIKYFSVIKPLVDISSTVLSGINTTTTSHLNESSRSDQTGIDYLLDYMYEEVENNVS